MMRSKFIYEIPEWVFVVSAYVANGRMFFFFYLQKQDHLGAL